VGGSDRTEFEEMFDLTTYEIVRKKYHAEGKYWDKK
jgi:hypothetical protein